MDAQKAVIQSGIQFAEATVKMRENDDKDGDMVTPAGESQCEPGPALPFSPLPEIDAAMMRELKAAAMEANQSYLVDLIEEHSFCPYSRGGRAQGQTARFVHYYSEQDVSPLFELMEKLAEDPSFVVGQVILPMVEVNPEKWTRFCHDVTDAGNKRLGGASEVFAVAPLHPELSYNQRNPFSLIPLFRRSPDPTIQWVRLDGLKALYEGRSGETIVVEGMDIMTFMQKKHKPPLFDRIAESNQRMAERLGIEALEKSFAEVSRKARRRYTSILLGDEGAALEARAEGQPCGGDCDSAPSKERPKAKVATRKDQNWSLATFRQLKQGEPCHVQVEEVDLVLVRAGDFVHVLYGRCPHRLALLSDAFASQSQLVCRHHGWDFELSTGRSEGVPGESIHRFSPWIADGQVWIADEEVKRWRTENAQAFELGELIP